MILKVLDILLDVYNVVVVVLAEGEAIVVVTVQQDQVGRGKIWSSGTNNCWR